MINSVTTTHASAVSQAAEPAQAAPPKTQTKQGSPLPKDTVSLKSTGDVDHDGDNK